MAIYTATLIHGETGGEGKYEFTAPDSLLSTTPVRAVRAFMETLEGPGLSGAHADYELNAAMRSGRDDVVTALGSFILENGDQVPFMVMIADKRD